MKNLNNRQSMIFVKIKTLLIYYLEPKHRKFQWIRRKKIKRLKKFQV